MDALDYMSTREFELLRERYEAHFNETLPTFELVRHDSEDIKKMIIESIDNDKALLPTDGDVLY